MKFNKLMLPTVIAIALTSVAYAASPIAPTASNQGHGKVTFNGEIINAPCSVAAESVDQTVAMGQISSNILDKKDKSHMEPFSIELKDCALSTMNNVKVTFAGTADPNNRKILALIGSTSGAGIMIYNKLHSKDVELGTETVGQALNKGDSSLKFAAYLQGSSASSTVVPGDFTSVANFTLAYL